MNYRLVVLWALLISLFLFSSNAFASGAENEAAAEAASDISSAEDEAAALAAEEAAAAAVGEAAEDEEDDDADALDEDADSARPDFELRHPLTDMPAPASDVDVGHAFSTDLGSDDASTSIVTLGEPIKTVIGFGNRGRMPYHVWGVMGSINMDKKFGIFVQNFTYGMVNKTVESGEELSFSYKFTPNERLDVRKFQLAVSVFYEARGSSGNAVRGHSTTFFNSTIETKAGEQTMSNGMFMILTAVVVGAGIAGVFVLRNTETKKSGAGETATEDRSKNEWLEEHETMAQTGGGRARRKAAASRS